MRQRQAVEAQQYCRCAGEVELVGFIVCVQNGSDDQSRNDPADRAEDANQRKLLLAIRHVAKRDGAGKSKRRHIA